LAPLLFNEKNIITLLLLLMLFLVPVQG